MAEVKMNRLVFLGSGTSQGVPVIGCHCPVCVSVDLKDKRLRSSVLFQIDEKNIVVDTGPDFRQQMLREKVQHLDAILFTHEHKDHVAGLDDVRAFNFKQKRDMPVFADERVLNALRREFFYVFTPNPYPGVPAIQLNAIENKDFEAVGIQFKPVEVMHHLLPVFGFRYKNIAYITDAKTIAKEEIIKLKGLDVLIINALRIEEHLSHFNLAQALEMIEMLEPKKAYLTHVSHYLGKHSEVEKGLPSNVHVAYDGLAIEF
jgi:phosphoribosyl 1,2-cyclic phosphate phosphodiesterase